MGAVREVLQVIQPRALAWGFLRGSWILLCLIWRSLATALKLAVSRPAAPPAKPKTAKADAEEDAEDAEVEEKAKPKAAPTRPVGNFTDQLGLAILAIVVGCGALSMVGTVLLYLLRPYMTIVATVLVLGWFAAALTADLVTRPENDHEKLAGEEPQGDAPEEAEEEGPEDDEEAREARWQAAQERLRTFVEHQVAATAGGYVEGIKGRGARVDDLLAEQQENGGLPGMERKGLMELLEMAGITVREQMKFRVLEETSAGWKWKQKNVPGVHVEDLAEDIGRTPRLPAHLVPSLDPSGAPISPPDPASIPAQETPPIPAARTAGE
ncbi:hypothetical protein OOK58_42205 [Streptomyces sp. NBC_01728]|uniref:hypothetical protein n=1 Tax=unclassified Streptomyces TaxID=2593676 RepID=UPI002251BAEC|nr:MULTISPECIES: hypothetical protein [unclassified Streptomyces]MCX4458529.1 hypothetical protein [Streptomyces sp. NBC_01719]MCX4497886.1 hypothetical protein [Streptomyces sp. NBC_01728]